MNIGGWGLANPAGLWFASIGLIVLALHVLRPRRTQAEVASTFLWKEVARPVSAARPWQRLIPSWLLLAQLLAALGLALAIAKPVKLTDDVVADHTIFVIDTSASMGATDGSPDRLADARDRVRDLAEQLSPGAEASIVVSGPPARAVLTRSTDDGAISDVLNTLDLSSGTDDMAGAFALAAGLNTGDRPTQVIVVSDGQIGAEVLRSAPIDSRLESVGRDGTNRGISTVSVEPSQDGLIVRFSVRSYGGGEATQPVRIDVDGVTRWNDEISLETGGVVSLTATVPSGDRVEVFLSSDDLLAIDNRAVAIAGQRDATTVAIIGPTNLFLDAALASIPGVSVERFTTWDELDTAASDVTRDPDIVISDGVALPSPLEWPTWAIETGGGGDIVASGTVTQPAITYVDPEAPVLAGVDPSEVLIAQAEQITLPPTATLLLGAEGAPLLAQTVVDDVAVIYQTFALDQSTLPLSASFPLLTDRIVSQLSAATISPPQLTVGDRIPLDPRREATVSRPDGTASSYAPGSTNPTATAVGFWSIAQPDASPVEVATNADNRESTIRPLGDLPFETAFEVDRAETEQGSISLVRWLAAILLVIVGCEYLLARRNVGVSRKQWHVAVGLRFAVALLLLGAIIQPTLSRTSDQLATMFVLDASDSVGPNGRSQASAFVASALANKPDDAKAGVVVFGENARLDTLLSTDPVFERIAANVSASATDLSAGLRLAAAALPADSRRRIVVVSDGIPTDGDHQAEIDRLIADGIPVDVVQLTRQTGDDVAVSNVQLPARAAVGDLINIDVGVVASTAGPALVRLFADGVEVGNQEVDLVAGESSVRFVDTVSNRTIARYQAEVSRPGDGVAANDVGYGALQVSGAERVLVVAADLDDAEPIVNALRSTGVEVDTEGPATLPPIDQLASYVSIVLVDVDRFSLAEEQVASLNSFVRDLGRGLVVVGGPSSFALGGYRGSDLEELLPVISEITDKLRKQTVAEVLAIDTSGSMAACHCDEEGANGMGGGSRIDGGVNKTTIARVAAADAIAALDATDEVGVLSVNASSNWVIDLQASPSQETIDAGLEKLNPDGPTNLKPGLTAAAEALRQSNAALKHIIYFSDGFTEPTDLADMADEAAKLFEEGITVSVVATGEGAAEDLRQIADAGGGRFYPGKSLDQIPALIVEEAVLASRSFINEGEFTPTITSNAVAVRTMTESPSINGFIATTPKDTARIDMRIGDEQDPLLASWRLGLGRVTAWTSDSGARWASNWAAWTSNQQFWSNVVRETFPAATEGGLVSAKLVGDTLNVTIEGSDAWDDNAQASVRVTLPDGESVEVPLDRSSGTTFTGSVAATQAGNYAVGGVVSLDDEPVWSAIGLVNRSYAREYDPLATTPEVLEPMAAATSGRVGVDATQVFSREATTAGKIRWDLLRWLLLAAVLLWPIAVVTSRLAWRSGPAAIGKRAAASAVSGLVRARPTFGEPGAKTRVESSPPSSSPLPSSRAAMSPPVKPATTITGPAEPPKPPSRSETPDGAPTSLQELLANKKNRNR